MSRVKISVALCFVVCILGSCKETDLRENQMVSQQSTYENKCEQSTEIVMYEEDMEEPGEQHKDENIEEDIPDDGVEESITLQPKDNDLTIDEEYIDNIVRKMSLQEKVAQMFFITPEALTDYSNVTAAGEITKSAYKEYPVGGIIYFANNLIEPDQTKEMLENISEFSMDTIQLPVFLGIDEEGGRVLRVGSQKNFGVEKVEAMGVLAEQKDENVVYEAGCTIGLYLKDLGFNTDFAPDADVITNTQNTVIGDRSFGTDAHEVADMAWAFSSGLHDAGLLSSYKHFPGHGGTETDSHLGYAYSYRTLEEMRGEELVPFQSGSQYGVDFIMVSHISTPKVTENDIPASLSKFWITDILRNELNYEGIIITDSMSMGAISENYSSDEATLLTIQAGADMILMPENFKSSYNAVLKAIDEGIISEDRINKSVHRIVKAKVQLLSYETN